MVICDKKICTECCSCMNICPEKAIKRTNIPKDILKSKVRDHLVSPFRQLNKLMKN